MTDAELIDLVYEKSPDEFSSEELGLLRGRMHDSNEIRLALRQRVQLEQGLVATLEPPPLPVAQIVSALTSGGAGGAALNLISPSSNGRPHPPAAGQAIPAAKESIRPAAATSVAPPSHLIAWAIRACVSVIVVSAAALTFVAVERGMNHPDDAPPAADPADQPPANPDPTQPVPPPDEDDERSPSDTVPPEFK